MSLRWAWSFFAVFLTAVISAVMALSIIDVEHDARRVGEDDQIRLTISILSDALSMPMMADSRAEVDALLEGFINISPGAMIYLRWANGKKEQFGEGEFPPAVRALAGASSQAISVKGLERWYAQGISFNKINLGTIALYRPDPARDVYSGEIKLRLVSVALLLALLAGGLVYRFSGSPSRSMRMLSKASKKVGAGKFSVHVPSYGSREIGQAIDDFNQMTSKLAQRQALHELFGRYQNPQQVSDAFDITLTDWDRPARTVAVMAVSMGDYAGYMSADREFGALSELNRFFSILNEIISAYGGHIDHLSGDRLMVVFNHPFNLRNYQDQAAKTALAVIEASKRLSLHCPDGGAVEFKVGLAQGKVLTGYLGTGRHIEFRIAGAPVSLAEHLAMLGSGHEVIAGGEIRRQLGNNFGQNDLGIRTLADGQNVHCVNILTATQSLTREIHDRVSAAFNNIEPDGTGAGEDDF